ncbi:hypothetical protein PENSPDRAFT_606237, partial [Peniophora sp. CONT]
MACWVCTPAWCEFLLAENLSIGLVRLVNDVFFGSSRQSHLFPTRITVHLPLGLLPSSIYTLLEEVDYTDIPVFLDVFQQCIVPFNLSIASNGLHPIIP